MITIKVKDYEVKLREPGFQEYRMAAMALRSTSGKIDMLGAGSALVQYCWEEGPDQLRKGDQSTDPEIVKCYVGLCTEAYHELFVTYDAQVKKN
jgi:hypothetical protein